MAYIDHQEAIWEPEPAILEAIWEPGHRRKYPNGSPEYNYFYQIFEYIDPSLLGNFKREVHRANTESPKPSGFLKWPNVWGESPHISYTDSIEKVFALLYNRRSANRWVEVTGGIVSDRKEDLDTHKDNPDCGF